MISETLKNKILSQQELPKNFLRFYAVGFLLFMLPVTRNLFFHITAISILLVIAAIFYHHERWTKACLFVFSFIAVSSFLIEMFGVNSGQIFGVYTYDIGLGLKINGTPLLIGINWVFLVYASQAIVSSKVHNPYARILGGSLLMVVYDSVMELAAPFMNMWHFNTCYPPIQNFVVWFLAALIFHSLFIAFKIPVNNKSAKALFWSQLLFFSLISLYSLIFIK